MAGGLFYVAAVILGVLAFILFLLSISVAYGWLPASDLANQSSAAMAVYGVIASASAIGTYKLSED
jgi:hypothetical protein